MLDLRGVWVDVSWSPLECLLQLEEFACSLSPGVILESSGDLGSGDSLFTDDDEDSFVLNDQARMDDEDDEDEDDDDVNDEYLS